MKDTATHLDDALDMQRILYGILLSVFLASCDQKELLCYPPTDTTVAFDVRYNRLWQVTYPGAIDWKEAWNEYGFDIPYDSLMPKVPDGLRVVVYDDNQLIAMYNIAAHGGDVNIDDDDNSVLMFNNDSEYIVYFNLDSISDATASTRSVQRSTYQGSPYVRNSVRLVNPPDMLYNVFLDEVEDDLHDGNVRLVMQPVVYTYLVRYQFDYGLDYVAIARGALAGMAEDVWLMTGYAGEDAVTILYDCHITDWGIEAVVRSFGAPSFAPQQKYGLNLEVRLKNGKILDYNFDITDQMRLQPKGGVIDVGGIEISDKVGKEDPGVFDVSVEGWGEFEDIPIDL